MAGPYLASDIRNYVGIGKQSSRGTGVTPTVFIPYDSATDLDHGMGSIEVMEGGVGPYVSRTMKSAHDPKGGFGLAWRPKTLAQLSAWFLGSDASVANGSLFDHTAKPALAPVYLSIEQNLADEVIERFIDGVLTEMVIDGDEAKDLHAGFKWEALSPARQASAATETYETGLVGSVGGPFRQTQVAYTIDGSANSDVKKYQITLTWSVENVRLNQVTGLYMPKLKLTGKITLSQIMLAETFYRTVAYGSSGGTGAAGNFAVGSFVALYDNGLATTNSRTVSINVPQIYWDKPKSPVLDAGGGTVFFEREGTITKDSVTPAEFVTIVTKNADTAAY